MGLMVDFIMYMYLLSMYFDEYYNIVVYCILFILIFWKKNFLELWSEICFIFIIMLLLNLWCNFYDVKIIIF